MHPVANAGLSVTAAEYLTNVLVWLLSYAHVTVPDNVHQSIAALIAIGCSYLVHRGTQPKPGVLQASPVPFLSGFPIQGPVAPAKPADPALAAPVQGA